MEEAEKAVGKGDREIQCGKVVRDWMIRRDRGTEFQGRVED
jgi:hypothetical protein